jgi:bis(5'-nucleosyl)-tetraphosphatase (symmetrical)
MIYPSKRLVFIGDVHGCIDELLSLIVKLDVKSDDTLVFLGDLIDRGPNPIAVVRYVRSLERAAHTYCVLGNHEDKCLRWLQAEDDIAAGKKLRNNMRPPWPDRLAEWNALSADDRAYLMSLPVILEFDHVGEHWVAVHAGLLPGKSLMEQVAEYRDQVIRCTWVDAAGNYALAVSNFQQPPGSYSWMSRYDGPSHVASGHFIHSLNVAMCWETVAHREAWCLDTGCFAGGHLTALVVHPDHRREVVQVKSARIYFARDEWVV